jgi:hypothetical protein
MWKSNASSQTTQISETKERYFKVQMKAWTNFDPMDTTLAEIAAAIEQGNGFLTAIEVVEAVDSLGSVNDEEVRDGFANLLAVRRLLSAIDNLPIKLKEELRSALEKGTNITVDNSVPKKGSVTSVEDFGRAQPRVEDSARHR